jgi:hypothetical protein
VNPTPLNPDFVDVLSAFGDEGVEFLIVGGFALAVHGAPRFTGDIDLWVRPTVANSLRVERALTKFGAPLATHGVTARDFEVPGAIYQMGLPPRRIDVLTEIDGVTFEDAWRGKVERDVGGLRLRFLGLQELLRNKRTSARPKDLLDVELLREAGVEVDTPE